MFRTPPERLQQYYENILETAVTSGNLSLEEVTLIRAFVSEIVATREISVNWKFQISAALVRFGEYLSNYYTCDTSEIFVAIEQY